MDYYKDTTYILLPVQLKIAFFLPSEFINTIRILEVASVLNKTPAMASLIAPSDW